MNIIFGIWRPQGPPVTKEELESMAVHTRRFASDGEWFHLCPEIGFGVQAQYTHERSQLEIQPASDMVGNLLIYDGRLDNYYDLMGELDLTGDKIPDSEIILCAYRRWGDECFGRFVGDWALVLWNASSRMLYLARDHAGARTLYYSIGLNGLIRWSTYLDSFVATELLTTLDPMYIATYLAGIPLYSKTPYRDVFSVLPSYFVKTDLNGVAPIQHWAPPLREQVAYGSAHEYEECFLHLFGNAVARRTTPDSAAVAHLSGGMDSTSIVCMSDTLRRNNNPEARLLDTLSFYDNSDPNWNERPYFTLVERARGKAGIHIDSSRYQLHLGHAPDTGSPNLYPGSDAINAEWDRALLSRTRPRGYRAIISGIGGDELTGGNADATPQLADYFVTGQLRAAASLAVTSCLAMRISLLAQIRHVLAFIWDHRNTSYLARAWTSMPWLTQSTITLCEASLVETPVPSYRPVATLPSSVDNSKVWWYMLRTQPHLRPSEVYRYEYRYPYLDRDLADFLLRVPQHRLSRPGRRRDLMRRALRGIVPTEIIERRRKAFALKGALAQINIIGETCESVFKTSLLEDQGFLISKQFTQAVRGAIATRHSEWFGVVLRAFNLELWLQRRAGHEVDDFIHRDSVPSILRDVSTETVPTSTG
jgi:asparagine synthase (glutamine-hydrolysing)